MSRVSPSFFEKEIRCDFLVDEKRKKVWAVELEMLEMLDAVCKKYGITYWAGYGTLLGAVRHQGFVPWDDDIDLVMLRDDYERFQSIAPQEFRDPYFFQNSYTDRIVWPFSKIRDSRTTGIEFKDLRDVNQGIFIDIFPLDTVFSGMQESLTHIGEMQKELWDIVTNPGGALLKLKQDLVEGKRPVSQAQDLLGVMKMDIKERFRVFEEFNLAHFGETGEINYIMYEICQNNYKSMKRDWFRETLYLPFEHLQIPAPVDYDKILTRCYGDYHQWVRGGTLHENIILEPDIPYAEYFAKYL